MQLSWLLFLWHMPDDATEGVAKHSFLGCNCTNQLACPSYSLDVQLIWYPMYYPEGMKARVSPVQSIEPHRILAPTRDSNPGPPGPESRVVTTILPLLKVLGQWQPLYYRCWRYLGNDNDFESVNTLCEAADAAMFSTIISNRHHMSFTNCCLLSKIAKALIR